MSRHAIISIANDNDPRDRHPRGDAAGYRSMLRERELERRLQDLEHRQAIQGERVLAKAGNPQIEWSLMLALFCALISTLAAAYCFYSGQGVLLAASALVAMVWSALWVTYLSSSARRSFTFTSEFSILLACIAGLGIWALTSREWGLSLSAPDNAAGFAGLTAVTAALLRSRLLLIVSVFGGIVWLAFHLNSPSIHKISIWIYSLLAVGQIFVSEQNKFKLSAGIALIGIYAWLFWTLNDHFSAGNISLLHIAAFCMLIGMSHYRLGKAAGDAQWVSANLHVVFGWAVGIFGAFGIQHYWLGASPDLWQDLSAQPLGIISWQVVGIVCIMIIGVAGLIRMAHRQMSSLAVLFSLAVAVAAAGLFDQRDAISALIQSELNMPAKPLIGLAVGAAIFASAAAMCINGARRKTFSMMFAGLAAIAVELALIVSPQYWTIETGLIFGFSLLASLSFAALFAANSESDYA